MMDYTSDIAGTIDEPKFKLIKITLLCIEIRGTQYITEKCFQKKGASIISGHFDTPFPVKNLPRSCLLFMTFWEGMVLMAGLSGMWNDSLIWWIVFFLAGAFVFGIIVSMVKLGTNVGRGARNRIVNFVNTTLHATPNQNDLDALMAAR